MHRVFVYGTLKTGEPNHYWLQSEYNGYSKLLGAGMSTEKYPLIIGTKFNIPFLLYAPGTGNIVKGEIYEVDRPMLDKLDELEGHPDYYVRELDKFILKTGDGTETQLECWVYFLKTFPAEALQKKQYSVYSSTDDHGLPYIERSKRETYQNYTIRDIMKDI